MAEINPTKLSDEIKEDLGRIEKAADVLINLALMEGRIADRETLTLSIDTLHTIGGEISSMVISIRERLHWAAQGGE